MIFVFCIKKFLFIFIKIRIKIKFNVKIIYNEINVSSIFFTRYTKTLYSDLEKLTKLFINYYNTFVTTYPIETMPTPCGNKTITSVTYRQYVNEVDNNIILNLYINIRNIEERKPYTQNQLGYFYENAWRLKKLSERLMLEYIDDQFKNKYNDKKGSLSYYKKKLKKKLDK